MLAQVKNTVDAALANAKVVGDQPVGKISGDITTSFKGGSYVAGKYAGGERDVREQESTLGDLVANALRDGIPAAQGKPDIGIVNPGGLRDELYYAGQPATNPANTDGVVTYAEANQVLPFVNNVWLVQVTGAQLKQVLEQQWQPAGADRTFLALGLSDNVRVTQDASKPIGKRITSVIVNGQVIDSKKTYTVSTFSFLGQGGDNFTAFKGGKPKDTGLVDRDVWISYLQKAGTIAPDFARQQVAEKNLKRSVKPNKKYTFRVSGLDLASLGSPQNTEVGVYATALVKGKPVQVKLGEFPVKDGLAKLNFRTPRIRFSQLSVVAEPTDTMIGVFHGHVHPPDQGQAATGDLEGAQARDRRQDQDLRQHRGQGARHAAQGLGRGQDRQEAVQGQAGRRQGRGEAAEVQDHGQEAAQGQVPRRQGLQARLQVHQPVGGPLR